MMLHYDVPALGNLLGFLALATYVGTLLPTTLRIVAPTLKTSYGVRFLLINRRPLGIVSFLFAVGHAYCVIRKRNFDFGALDTYIASAEGTAMLIIFTLLAVTSNDWSVKRLKRHWKQLHTLTYLAMFLLIWHLTSKMTGQWTWITPFSLGAMVTISLLFLVRKGREAQPKLNQVRWVGLFERSQGKSMPAKGGTP